MDKNTMGATNCGRMPTEPAVLNDPLRNRGVAFTLAERAALGLRPGDVDVIVCSDAEEIRPSTANLP
jgi:hypothetical protein